MVSIDTNVLLRIVMNDTSKTSAEQIQSARKLAAEEEKIFVTQGVQIELVWVLVKAYKVTKDNILIVLNELLENKAFILQRHDHFEAAVKLYKNSTAGFADCLILAESNSNGSNYLYTFDKKLAKLHGAKELKY